MTIGYEVRRRRKAKGMTVAGLAEAASAVPGAPDVGVDQVARIETGRATISLMPDEEPLVWVALALGLSLRDLIGDALTVTPDLISVRR